MSTETWTEAETRAQGWDALVSRLGVAGAIRFLQSITPGRGDYTAERQQRPSVESLDMILKRIRERHLQEQDQT
jgi:hypothetical protein